jgi:hypothetical protein
MGACIYSPGGACRKDVVLNFEMCLDHLNTARGLQHMVDTVRNGRVITQKDIDELIAKRTRIPEKDYQTTALERMVEAIDRVLEFERTTERMVADLDPSDWRYEDRRGAEQLRSEVSLYERALDRTASVLNQISKMAIAEKMVSLGKAQTELMVKILMGTISELKLDSVQTRQAQQILLAKLKDEARLPARTQEHIAGELEASTSGVIDG